MNKNINVGIVDVATQDTVIKMKANSATALDFKHGATSILKMDTRGTPSSTPSTGAVVVTGLSL